MTPSAFGIIRPGSLIGDAIGLDPGRFGPNTYVLGYGNRLGFWYLDILGDQPRKILHDLVARANAGGYTVIIPHKAGDPVDPEFLEWGFVLQSFTGVARQAFYVRGPRGMPQVDAVAEKFGVRVEVGDEGTDLGFVVRVTVQGAVVATLAVDAGGVRVPPEEGDPP